MIEQGSIYWQMLEDARDIIKRYWDSKEQDSESFVKEISGFREKYNITDFMKRYPNMNETQQHNADVLDIWAYHIEMAMINAFDDITLKRWHRGNSSVH